MAEPSSRESSEPDADREFAEFVEQLLTHLREGRSGQAERLTGESPDYAERLRAFLPALASTVGLSGASREPAGGATEIPENRRTGSEKILGDFRILRQIGRGGMGIVYEAEQISLRRRVALKILPFATLVDPKHLQRFKTESLIEGQLSHPNIVSVLSVGQENHVHFFAMPLIDGVSAAEWIARWRQDAELTQASNHTRGGFKTEIREGEAPAEPKTRKTQARQEPRPPGFAAAPSESVANPSAKTDSNIVRERLNRVSDIARQIACALEYAHQNGVLHRDVKPSNILVDKHGKAYLTDFGLAHAPDVNLTMTGDVMGTLRYMSPEQALGRRAEVGERSDIYSLGATLYEMVTLRPMFADEDTESLLSAIAGHEPARLRAIDAQIPRDLETIVLTATAKESRDRYESAQAMADDLQRFLDDRPILAHRPRLADRVARWSRRHRGLVYTAVGVSLLLSAILGVSSLVVLRGSQRTQSALDHVAELLYASDMQLAYQAWDKKWIGEAVSILARHIPEAKDRDQRGVEWFLLRSLVERSPPLVFYSHPGVVSELAVFPDRERIVTVGDDGLVRIWQVPQGHLLSTIKTGDAMLAAVAVSPCGTMVATGENTVAIWDVDSGKKIRDLTTHETTVEAIAFSPDGRFVVSASRYKDLRVCTIEGELKGHYLTGSRNESVCFSADGHRLYVSVRDLTNVLHDHIRVFELNIDQGDETESASDEPLLTEKQVWRRPTHLTFAAVNSGLIAFASRYNGRVFLSKEDDQSWNRELPPQKDQLNAVAISPNGQYFVSAHNDGSIVWRPISRIDEYGHERRMSVHRGAVTDLQFIDDRRLATCGADGAIRIWNLGPSERALSIAANEVQSVRDLAFSADANHLAIVGDSGLLWHGRADGSNGQTWRYEGPVTMDLDDVDYSPRGDLLALTSESSNQILLWDVNRRAVRNSFEHAERTVHDACFSPDGGSLATTGDDALVHLWNLANGTESEHLSLPHHGWALAYSPDGSRLAAGGRFSEILIWDLSQRKVVLRLRANSDTRDLAFQPDGPLLASAHSDGHLRLWDLRSGERIADFQSHEGAINQLAFSHVGGTVATVSDDGTIRLWSADLHCPIGIVERRATDAFAVAFAPDDSAIVAGWGSGNYDASAVLLWEIDRSREIPIRPARK